MKQEAKPVGAETLQGWAAFFADAKIKLAHAEAERMVELGEMLRIVGKQQTEH